mgnify:FL=1|jgi:sugar fermentation stimulation protein A
MVRKGVFYTMKYGEMIPGRFCTRPNRFVAHVELKGQEEICHVKNTGRCRELLLPGARGWCRFDGNPERKTHYDLIAVEKAGRLINMDSQAPNQTAAEWLSAGGLGEVEALWREWTHGDSRFDFSFLQGGRRCFLEVKGVTLEEDGVVRFPEAPTLRGTKHLLGLAQAAAAGYGAYVLFVIQMGNVKYFAPNDRTDPAFGAALRKAAASGVQILAMDCIVTPDSMALDRPVPVHLA